MDIKSLFTYRIFWAYDGHMKPLIWTAYKFLLYCSMKKNNSRRKQRVASAKRGLKKFKREKKSRENRHIRLERRMKQRIFRENKLNELINRLSGANEGIIEQEAKEYVELASQKEADTN